MMGAGMMKKIGIRAGAIAVLAGTILYGHDSIRVVRLKVACDREFERCGRLPAVRTLISEVSDVYEKRFGIRLLVTGVFPWKSNDQRPDIPGLLTDLRKKVPKDGCDAVLGLTGQSYAGKTFMRGAASYQTGYLIMRELKSDDLWKLAFTHEIAHLFGAVDLDEPGSIMNQEGHGERFDEFSARVIRLHRDRGFLSHRYPLDQDKWPAAAALYRQRKRLKRHEHGLNLQLAWLYFKMGEYRRMEEECRELVEVNPYCSEALNFMAVAQCRLNRYAAAERYFDAALSLDPFCPEIHNNRGLNFLKMGDWETAVRSFRTCVQLCPGCAEAYGNLAYAFLRLNHLEAAERECRRALALCPDLDAVLSTWAEILIHKGDLTQAERISRLALEKGPERAGPHINLGLIFTRQKKYPDALRACERALGLEPENGVVLNRMGEIHCLMGHPELAVPLFLRLTRVEKESPRGYVNLATAWLESGRPHKAVEACRKALEIQPENALALCNLARAKLELGEAGEAENACLQALTFNDRSPDIFNTFGLILRRLGDRSQAEAAFLKAVELDPDGLEPNLNLGDIYLESGAYPRAERHYRKVLDRDPDIGQVYNNLAVIRFHESDFEEAWKLVGEAEDRGFPVHPGFRRALQDRLRKTAATAALS
jgi:tetratricopeptide (TPR) repeat protein